MFKLFKYFPNTMLIVFLVMLIMVLEFKTVFYVKPALTVAGMVLVNVHLAMQDFTVPIRECRKKLTVPRDFSVPFTL